VSEDELDPVQDVAQAEQGLGGRPPDHPEDLVALLQQEIGQVASVLPRDPGYQGTFFHIASPAPF
jgi:hypothetical protein